MVTNTSLKPPISRNFSSSGSAGGSARRGGVSCAFARFARPRSLAFGRSMPWATAASSTSSPDHCDSRLSTTMLVLV